MLGQAKNIKGFNLLELIVVLTIVGVISAVAYPNFSSWNKERKVRAAVIKIETLVRNAYVQTERGTFAYVQVLFNNNEDQLVVTSKGITMANLVTKMNDMNDEWNTNPQLRCNVNDDGYWDTDQDTTSNDIRNAVYSITLTDVSTNFSDTPSAVCFARNGKFHEASGELTSNAATGVPHQFVYICRRDRANPICDINDTSGDVDVCPGSEIMMSRVHWNRFGNMQVSKFVNEYILDPTSKEKRWECENPNYVYE